MATISSKENESHLFCHFFSFCLNTQWQNWHSTPQKKTPTNLEWEAVGFEAGSKRLRLAREWIASHLKSSHYVQKPEGSSVFLYDKTTSEMYCKIIRSKQAGKMSDALLFISWASLVPATLQAEAVSVGIVEVEINPVCVFFPYGFTEPQGMMDNRICCRKEAELYTLLWLFGFPFYLYPSLREKEVCAK